jgi:hypothetical protein
MITMGVLLFENVRSMISSSSDAVPLALFVTLTGLAAGTLMIRTVFGNQLTRPSLHLAVVGLMGPAVGTLFLAFGISWHLPTTLSLMLAVGAGFASAIYTVETVTREIAKVIDFEAVSD